MRIRCPTCKEFADIETDAPFRPFCSSRCKVVDLGNWLDEAYRFSRPLNAYDLSDDEYSLE